MKVQCEVHTAHFSEEYNKLFRIVNNNELVETTEDAFIYLRGDVIKDFFVPAGYQFDGASIPPQFWGLIGEPDDEDFLRAAFVHDYLYGRRYNRKIADKIFEKFLIDEGVPRWKAKLMWVAVRLGGFVFYAGDTNKFWKKVRNFLD